MPNHNGRLTNGNKISWMEMTAHYVLCYSLYFRNLQHLYIEHHLLPETVYLKRMIDRIAKATFEPQIDTNRSEEIPTMENSSHPHALHKFTTLGLQSSCWFDGTESGNDYDSLLLLINLSSVRSFIGRLRQSPRRSPLMPLALNRVSFPYQNLHLCYDIPAALQPLLSNFRSLGSFSFTAAGGRRIEDGSQSGNMLATLLQCAGHGLQELSLHLEDHNVEDAGAWDALGSLIPVEKEALWK